MRTITLEEHFLTPAYVEATTHLSIGNESNPRMKAIQAKQLDLDAGRLADMDANGITMQVLSLSGVLLDKLDASTATVIARDANDTAAEAVRSHPDRFAAFAALGMQDPVSAASEFTRCVRDLGFVGAIVNGTTGGLFLDDPKFTPIFDVAQALNVPIYLHPAPPPQPVMNAYFSGLPAPFGQMLSIAGWGWHVETGLHVLRLMVSGVLDRFPDVQIIIGHMGEDLPFSLARAESILNSSPKPLARKPSEYFASQFHVTTSGYFTIPPFLCALSVVGADRLLFSVDYPFSENATGRAFLDSLPVSVGDREKIAYRNADRLLGLVASGKSPDPFATRRRQRPAVRARA